MELYILSSATVALAFFQQRITGFGSAVIATPLLALIWAPHEAIALMLIFQAVFGFWLIGKVWRRLLDPEVRIFMFVFIPAIIASAYLLPAMSSDIVRKALAAVVIVVLLQWLLLPSFKIQKRLQAFAAALFGLLSGGVQGALGMGGPFFLFYYGSVEERTDRIRDSLIAVFTVANLVRLPVALATAQFTEPVLLASAVAALPFVAVMILGAKVSVRVEPKIYRTIVSAVLAFAAINLTFS